MAGGERAVVENAATCLSDHVAPVCAITVFTLRGAAAHQALALRAAGVLRDGDPEGFAALLDGLFAAKAEASDTDERRAFLAAARDAVVAAAPPLAEAFIPCGHAFDMINGEGRGALASFTGVQRSWSAGDGDISAECVVDPSIGWLVITAQVDGAVHRAAIAPRWW